MAKPLDEVVTGVHPEGVDLVVHYLRAPNKEQGPSGKWRVVRVRECRGSIILSAAWQPPAGALEPDAELR